MKTQPIGELLIQGDRVSLQYLNTSRKRNAMKLRYFNTHTDVTFKN